MGGDGTSGGLGSEVPGPGAYAPKKTQDEYRFRSSPTYSMAPCRRTDPAAVAAREAVPGPEYDVAVGVEKPDPRRNLAPAYSMGELLR